MICHLSLKVFKRLHNMNQSVERQWNLFQKRCYIFGKTHTLINKPSYMLLVNDIAVLTVNIILIVPTILLNAVSITTITKSSQLRNKICYFIILVQSVTDLVVGFLGIPSFVLFLITGIGEKTNCTVSILAYRSTVLSIGVSFFTLSALTMERYIAILHRYKYIAQVTKKRILMYICSGVVLLLFVIICSLVIEGLIKSFTVLLTTCFFILIVFVYTRIYLVVRKLSSPPVQVGGTPAANNMTRKNVLIQEIRQTKRCFIVVVVFILFCLLPVLVTFFVASTLDQYGLQTIQNWATTLSILNSSVNSVIFFWTKSLLRKEALKTLYTICSILSMVH